MAPELRIGLTGGIASGKSTVALRFVELGVPVIDADESARAVVAAGTPGLEAVIARFGAHVSTPGGELDRAALRRQIFADSAARRDLESLLHPLIRAHMERRAADSTGPYLVMAVPLLVESGERSRFDRVLVVDAEEKFQLERLIARDGGTRADAEAILAAQASRAERLRAADDVLENSGTTADLRAAVDSLHNRYLCLAESLAERRDRLT